MQVFFYEALKKKFALKEFCVLVKVFWLLMPLMIIRATDLCCVRHAVFALRVSKRDLVNSHLLQISVITVLSKYVSKQIL